MSIPSKKVLGAKIATVLATAALALGSTGAFAQDRYDDGRYNDRPEYDRPGYDDRDNDGYDYARVVDVQPLTRQVRVSSPQRECWDETRYDEPNYSPPRPRNSGGATLLGAVIGAAVGNQIGHGHGRHAATAAGAIIGASIGNAEAGRRNGYEQPPPPRAYTVQRCETHYREDVQERVDGYRVTYVYNGRRGVTELPYRPGDRIRVRVDVSPAE
ncbi:MAG TPA: glycine zipper 2TM domain-containing protein [Steroidobacteraceae bacterium]|nr:glycine zipper 2TM domain-containing protein [Steroidobacteraceae bacterium]